MHASTLADLRARRDAIEAQRRQMHGLREHSAMGALENVSAHAAVARRRAHLQREQNAASADAHARVRADVDAALARCSAALRGSGASMALEAAKRQLVETAVREYPSWKLSQQASMRAQLSRAEESRVSAERTHAQMQQLLEEDERLRQQLRERAADASAATQRAQAAMSAVAARRAPGVDVHMPRVSTWIAPKSAAASETPTASPSVVAFAPNDVARMQSPPSLDALAPPRLTSTSMTPSFAAAPVEELARRSTSAAAASQVSLSSHVPGHAVFPAATSWSGAGRALLAEPPASTALSSHTASVSTMPAVLHNAMPQLHGDEEDLPAPEPSLHPARVPTLHTGGMPVEPARAAYEDVITSAHTPSPNLALGAPQLHEFAPSARSERPDASELHARTLALEQGHERVPEPVPEPEPSPSGAGLGGVFSLFGGSGTVLGSSISVVGLRSQKRQRALGLPTGTTLGTAVSSAVGSRATTPASVLTEGSMGPPNSVATGVGGADEFAHDIGSDTASETGSRTSQARSVPQPPLGSGSARSLGILGSAAPYGAGARPPRVPAKTSYGMWGAGGGEELNADEFD